MAFESVGFTRSHWSEETRVAAGALGAFLLGRAIFGRGLLRPVFGVAGGALLARAVTNRPLRRALRERAEEAGALGRAGDEVRRTVDEVKSSAEGPARRKPPRGGEGHGWDAATAGMPGDEPFAGGPPVEPPAAGVPAPSEAKDARAGSETERDGQ